MKKKLLQKNSTNIGELRRLLNTPNSRPRQPATKPASSCDECRFIAPPNAKIRFIRDNLSGRVVCEVCFEKVNISDWEFVQTAV